MSERKLTAASVAAYFDGLYTLGGAVLDRESYLRHRNTFDETAGVPSAVPPVPDAAADTADPFAQPQDLRQLAAQAFETDAGRQEYRPEAAAPPPSADAPAEEGGRAVFVPGEPMLVFTGSGSYFSSGSYQYGSGSYRRGSGSFAPGSGSYSPEADDLLGFGGYGLGLI